MSSSKFEMLFYSLFLGPVNLHLDHLTKAILISKCSTLSVSILKTNHCDKV